MAEWTRNTPWRGRLLTKEAVTATGLSHPEYQDDTMAIVASHDCDLTQPPDREPQVEVIVGRKISALDGNSTHGKSPRTLHLEFQGHESVFGEFVITEKKSIRKNLLADFAPDTRSILGSADLHTFQFWLASRYNRPAFPDEFERRLNESGLAEKIARALKTSSMAIRAILFEVSGGPEMAHEGSDDVYLLDIMLLYASEPDSQAAEKTAKEIRKKIEEAFKTKLLDTKSGNWQSIELRYIDIISDEAMTVRQSEAYTRWRLDYLSLRADPQQPVVAE